MKVKLVLLVKATPNLPVGTEHVFGGKPYIKTELGWRPKKRAAISEKEKQAFKEKQSKHLNHEQLAERTGHSVFAAMHAPVGTKYKHKSRTYTKVAHHTWEAA